MQPAYHNLHNETHQCLFCGAIAKAEDGLPANVYRGLSCGFLRCENCQLLFLSNLPSGSELNLMYASSYQENLSMGQFDISQAMPGMRFSYVKQFDLIRKHVPVGSGLDFGCGNGHFIYHAKNHGMMFDGMEFTDSVVSELRSRLPGVHFMNKRDFDLSVKKYPVIRLSNVLEHFTDPVVQFQSLIDKLSPDGIILVEGPLETNPSLVNWSKWWYLKIRKLLNRNFTTAYPPYHIIFSNYNNQLRFFASFGLRTLEYEIREDVWPFTSNWKDVHSLATFAKFLLAKFSLIICKIIPRSGNTFIYVGQKA